MIKKITAIETYSIRHSVLRKGKPLDSCHFEGDELLSTLHLGLYHHEKLIAVASIFEKSNIHFNDSKQFQIRGVAVLETYQRHGFGEKLIKEAENHIINSNGKIIWFNARYSAINFYKKLGYKITGIPFDIENIGIHYLMSKHLMS